MTPHRILFAILCIVSAIAAEAEVKWPSTEYAFGLIREWKGSVEGELKFINTGSEAVMVNNVKTSCGCTGVSYPKDPIEPGDTASISFLFDPYGYFGEFDKTIKVYTGSENMLTTLHLKGTVIGSDETLRYSYPVKLGPLMLSARVFDGKKIAQGESAEFFLDVYNQYENPVIPKFTSASTGMDIISYTDTLPAGVGGRYIFRCNTREMSDVGPMEIHVKAEVAANDTLFADDLILPIDINPIAKNLSREEIANAPQIKILPEILDLGIIKGDTNIEFVIHNAGKSPLVISRIYSPSPAVKFRSWPAKIEAGKNGVVKGRIYPSLTDSGALGTDIHVYSDDPYRPVYKIRLAVEL